MGKKDKAKKKAQDQAVAGEKPRKLPKRECCASKSKCGRCPLRMLKEGTLPEGYTVKKRKLVRVDGGKVTKKDLGKVA
ncbi:hypothetical protein [Nocardioides marmotae]|uniref:Uncharacterized protein n=1 Tax=Nocardioides marmotae TaxID=2663857 RepID=A0A6I3JB79_9ACTN|nr:hypothetical protein [Nocardioides marmotae]MCR6031680.1 hypothetical protein [Gordonia jinghuaiqii]MBC9733161.1 hypothetical protein [Nocardioides marmotae]MTB84273.1 hypothetical protein [Nocardioides marmotae]MTB95319.1 hypothetical protein [Nocardioides marmotae]QKD99659.1 hypothetical protein HPC71_14900 [Nocardioides marmotae]